MTEKHQSTQYFQYRLWVGAWLVWAIFLLPLTTEAQFLSDNFEGNGNIGSWFGDDCGVNTAFANPHPSGINPSATVLRYHDQGGQYANVRFDIPGNFDLSTQQTFTFKIYVPSSSLTGNAPNRVSLKLQNGVLASPWTTQTEIIKPLLLDQWQTVSFDFANDSYINLDPNSLPPVQRTDLNRVLIQVNGENNSFQVLAYIDDFCSTAPHLHLRPTPSWCGRTSSTAAAPSILRSGFIKRVYPMAAVGTTAKFSITPTA